MRANSASALLLATVDGAPGYQQTTHTLVPFFRTGRKAENREMQTRTETDLESPVLPTDESGSPAWQELAKCVSYAGRVDFFPARGESVRDAKEVCASCDVRRECLDFALRMKVAHGVWGGLSERERRTLRRERHKPSRASCPEG